MAAFPVTGTHLPTEPATSGAVLIQRVSVVDCTNQKPRLNQDVLVEENHIVSVTKSRFPAVPPGTRTVDGKRKFLIPGLWDMHVHGTANPEFSGLYIANGVTGVRDMFDLTGRTFGIRDQIRAGTLIGPRIVAAGKVIDGPNPVWPGSLTASNAAEGVQDVQIALGQGSDFIKVYSMLPRDAFFAIARQAKNRHVPFAGHVPESVTIQEASYAGMHSMEHLYGVLRACSPTFKEPVSLFAGRAKWVRYNTAWLNTYDPKLAARLFAVLKNHNYQTPTLTVWYWMYHPEDPRKDEQYRFAYMPPYTEQRFESGRLERYRKWKPADFKIEGAMFKKYVEIVGAMNKAGVPIMAGTDVNNPYCFPGFGIHDELRWLVKAGLSPFQALRAATLTPAEYLGFQNSLGTIQPGKLADCVLLDANPLKDIGNAERVSAVLLNGRFLDRAALSRLMPKNRFTAQKKIDTTTGIDRDE